MRHPVRLIRSLIYRSYSSMCVPSRLSDATKRRFAKAAKRKHSLFVKGPIPVAWLQRAGELPGKVLHVGIALWFRCGIEKNKTVKLCARTGRQFGVSRQTTYRALAALERANLVSVDRGGGRGGRCPRVTIIEAEDESTESTSEASACPPTAPNHVRLPTQADHTRDDTGNVVEVVPGRPSVPGLNRHD